MAVARLLCFAVLFAAVSAAWVGDTEDANSDRVGRSHFWNAFADGFRAIEQQAESHIQSAMGGLVRRLSAAMQPSAGGVKEAGSTVIAADDYDEDDNDSDEAAGVATALAGLNDFTLTHLPKWSSNFMGSFTSATGELVGRLEHPKAWWTGPNVCVERKEEISTPAGGGRSNPSVPESGTKVDAEDTMAVTERDREPLEDDEDDDDEPAEKLVRLGIGFNNHVQINKCQETATVHECNATTYGNGVIKTIIERRRCCPGTKRVAGQPGCTKVEMKTVLETAASKGAAVFVKLVEPTGLSKSFGDDANVTLFAPTDKALSDYSEGVMEQNDVSRIRREATESSEDSAAKPKSRSFSAKNLESAELIMAHTVRGRYEMSELDRDQVLHTLDDNSTIRIAKYLEGTRKEVITANCARVTSANHQSTNGMVHIVDRVLQPVPKDKTLATIIEEDPELSTLRALLEKAGLMDTLREKGPMTVFAPTNKAFDEMENKDKANLFAGLCDDVILKHHLVGMTICSAIAQEIPIQALNLNGRLISLKRREKEGQLFFDGTAEITAMDIVGSNGVLHIVNGVIVPESALPLSRMMESQNLTHWIEVMKRTKLLDEIERYTNYTLMIPTPEALEEIQELTSANDAEADRKLRDIVLYHTVKSYVGSGELKNGRELKSELDGKGIRINLYAGPFLRTLGTLQCARALVPDTYPFNRPERPVCGGIVYIIDKIMQPALRSVTDILSDEKFSKFRNLLETSNVLSKLSGEGPYTVIAPSNRAISAVSEYNMKKLMSSKDLLERVLKRHIFPASLCCAGVRKFPWPFTSTSETLAGDAAPLWSHYGSIQIWDTEVAECDMMATNGIVHEINRMVLPVDFTIYRHSVVFNSRQDPNADVVLFGL